MTNPAKRDPIDDIADALTAFDRRMSDGDIRMNVIESEMCESARATDEIARNTAKLTDLYLEISSNLSDVKALLTNYVDETRRLRVTSQQLVSEVREKLRVNGG